MIKNLCVLLMFFSFLNCTFAQPLTDNFLQKLLIEKASPLLLRILNKPDSFRYQLIYTQINRDRKNNPSFKNYYLHVDKELYFNPASTVKLPVALIALEKLNKRKITGINKYTTMLLDSSYSGQKDVVERFHKH